MATKYGHIYTKDNSGSVDKFVPILNSTDIKHGDEDNVGEILDKSAKSVETEIDTGTETVNVNEVIYDNNSDGELEFITIDGYNPQGQYTSYVVIYNSAYSGPIELNTNETFTSTQFQISSQVSGIQIGFSFNSRNDGFGYRYITMPNGTYNWGPSFTISNSPYTADSYSAVSGNMSVSELPSVGQSKIFYPTVKQKANLSTWASTYTEYTGTDIKFTITNIDGTNYTLSFIWEKTKEITVKSLKTTVTKNDDTETEETNEISGLLQNSNITFEQKLVTAQLYDIQANIEVWADN